MGELSTHMVTLTEGNHLADQDTSLLSPHGDALWQLLHTLSSNAFLRNANLPSRKWPHYCVSRFLSARVHWPTSISVGHTQTAGTMLKVLKTVRKYPCQRSNRRSHFTIFTTKRCSSSCFLSICMYAPSFSSSSSTLYPGIGSKHRRHDVGAGCDVRRLVHYSLVYVSTSLFFLGSRWEAVLNGHSGLKLHANRNRMKGAILRYTS